jgi:hypothetical protein
MKMRRFVFRLNREKITKIMSDKLTVLIPDPVPVEVIELWKKRLASHLARRIGRLRHSNRRWKRRRPLSLRDTRRMRRVKRRKKGPMRKWDPMPRR